MTRLGKLLVYLNVALSIAMAGLALGLYSNRVDWAGTKPSESEGELKKFETELNNKREHFGRSVTRWRQEGKLLSDAEAFQAMARPWYAQQLELLVKGRGPRVPVDVLVYNGGVVRLDPKGLPMLQPSPDKALWAETVLDQETLATDNEIAKEIAETQTLIDEENKLTLALNGRPGNPKGLRALLVEMLAAEKRSGEELLYVKRERINSREATNSLLHRQQQLRDRLNLLRKERVAGQAP